MKLAGSVEQIATKTVNTRYGPKPVYSMEVEGNWIDLGFKNPGYEEGEYVDLDVEKNRYGKYEIVTGGSSKNGAGSAPARSTSTGTKTRSREESGFPVPTNNYQMGIIRQNALTNAVNTVISSGAHEGTSTDELVELIIDVAYDFVDFSSGQREVKRAKALTEGKSEND